MPRRRRPTKRQLRRRRLIAAVLLAPFALYLFAALVGTLVPVNRGWTEAERGTTIYLASNGIHTDIILPVRAEGLDWTPLFPRRDFAAPPSGARWIAFGAGERGIYLDTPRWRDLKPGTALRAIAGGERVMRVEWLADTAHAQREIRLRPEEYRRLWAAIRADFTLDERGRPVQIDHPGYGPGDAFYRSGGKISAIRTCNVWAGDKLRLAGVKTSLWSPSVLGLRRHRVRALA
jgi:uncharacterized protein (TIGR02117 family)